MPNWCTNVLTVSGPASDLSAARSKFAAPYAQPGSEEMNTGPLLLWNLANPCPTPEDVARYDQDWFDMHLEAWGTKWDVDSSLQVDPETGNLIYSFASAWSPPIGAVISASADWPTLTFEIDYDEPGSDFSGLEVYQAGEVVAAEQGPSRSFFCPVCEMGSYIPRGQELACPIVASSETSPHCIEVDLHVVDGSLDGDVARAISGVLSNPNVVGAVEGLAPLLENNARMGSAQARAELIVALDSVMSPEVASLLVSGLRAGEVQLLVEHEDERVRHVALDGLVTLGLGLSS